MWVNFLRVLGLSVFGLAVLFGGVFLFSPKVDYQHPERLRPLGTEPFDSARWATSDPEQRGKMVYDFVRRRLYRGKDQRALAELLGKPTARYLDPSHFAYRVGASAVKSRFGERFTFALIWNEHDKQFDRFWIEPFPEEALKQ